MADVVFFYASADINVAEPLVERLREELNPLSVWWDEGIRRSSWNRDVMKELHDAKCVIALWSQNAAEMDRQSIMNELVEAEKLKLPIVVAKIDNAKLRGPTENGSIVSIGPDDDINLLHTEVFSVLNNGRKWECLSGDNHLSFPQFLRSVSSHETFASPVELLKALLIHPSTDPVLISSFDIFTSEKDKQKIASLLEKISARGILVFLDSGNYEAYRKCENFGDETRRKYRLNKTVEFKWTPNQHQIILEKLSADFAFQFDPIDNLSKTTPDAISMHAVTYFKSDQKVNSRSEIIPILHLPKDENNTPEFKHLVKIAENLINEIDPKFIAIPERELGDGIIQRAKTINNLRRHLDSSGKYRYIHLLGTGNPISIAILAQAGADSFDGLEWCRTVSNHTNAHLFHTQHFDLFSYQAFDDPFLHPVVKNLLNDHETPWHQKLLLHNLEFFNEWMKKLRFHLQRGTIIPLLKKSLTDEEIKLLQEQSDGIIR